MYTFDIEISNTAVSRNAGFSATKKQLIDWLAGDASETRRLLKWNFAAPVQYGAGLVLVQNAQALDHACIDEEETRRRGRR